MLLMQRESSCRDSFDRVLMHGVWVRPFDVWQGRISVMSTLSHRMSYETWEVTGRKIGVGVCWWSRAVPMFVRVVGRSRIGGEMWRNHVVGNTMAMVHAIVVELISTSMITRWESIDGDGCRFSKRGAPRATSVGTRTTLRLGGRNRGRS